MLYSIQIAI